MAYKRLNFIDLHHFLLFTFKGLGYCNLVIVSTIGVYYFVVISWILYYFYISFFPRIIWGRCDNAWNTDMCNSLVQDLACQEENNGTINDQIFFNRTCREIGSICQQFNLDPLDARHCWNMSSSSNMTIPEVIPRVFSSEEFFL